MERFLKRLAVPDRCFELVHEVIATCESCQAFAPPPPRRPKYGAELAGWFGDCMIGDLFFLWGFTFLIMIDEAVRFKVASHLPDRTANTIMKTLLRDWLRYFGPPRRLRFDQEGGVRAEEFGKACDRYSIHRELAGSDDTGNIHELAWRSGTFSSSSFHL